MKRSESRSENKKIALFNLCQPECRACKQNWPENAPFQLILTTPWSCIWRGSDALAKSTLCQKCCTKSSQRSWLQAKLYKPSFGNCPLRVSLLSYLLSPHSFTKYRIGIGNEKQVWYIKSLLLGVTKTHRAALPDSRQCLNKVALSPVPVLAPVTVPSSQMSWPKIINSGSPRLGPVVQSAGHQMQSTAPAMMSSTINYHQHWTMDIPSFWPSDMNV